jgi:hypothetical protein
MRAGFELTGVDPPCGIFGQVPNLQFEASLASGARNAERWFYSAVGASFLLIMLLGFYPFIISGSGDAGRVIDPVIFRLDLIHGLAIAAWYVLFFIQALLINVRIAGSISSSVGASSPSPWRSSSQDRG